MPHPSENPGKIAHGVPDARSGDEPAGAFFYMDAMRTLFALLVAFGHAWALFIRDYQPPADLAVQAGYYAAGFGHQAVILFFVLSGFWISRSVVRAAANDWSWRRYLSARLTRLLPVLIGALVIGGLLDFIAVYALRSPTHLGLTGSYVLRIDVAKHLSWDVLLANAAFLQVIVPTFGTNGPLWSLSYEFWFYIWFPALWLALRHRRFSIALATLALGWFAPKLSLAFVSWLCGAALYGVSRWTAGRPLPSRRTQWALTIAAALLLAIVFAEDRFAINSWKDPTLALAFAIFLLSLMRLDPQPARMLQPVASFGARASFSFYATHFPVMAFVAALTLGSQRLAPDLRGAGLVAAVIAGTLAFAWFFAKQTEARTPALRDWLDSLLPVREPSLRT